jgi:cytochrome c oxidase subunit 6b
MADDKSVEEIAAQSKGGLIWSTASYNPYFPYTNVSRYCWASFVEFQRCVNEKGDAENPTCKKYQGSFSAMCPKDWVT